MLRLLSISVRPPSNRARTGWTARRAGCLLCCCSDSSSPQSLLATHLVVTSLTYSLTHNLNHNHACSLPAPLPLATTRPLRLPPTARLLSTMDPSFLVDAGVMDAWNQLGKTCSSNNNMAPLRDKAGDEGVFAPKSQRQSGGRLPTITQRQRLAAARCPIPVPSHLHHDTDFDVPDDQITQTKRKTAAGTTDSPVKKRKRATGNPSPKKGKSQSNTELRRPEDEGEDWSKTEEE
jgi:hypothetical protein